MIRTKRRRQKDAKEISNEEWWTQSILVFVLNIDEDPMAVAEPVFRDPVTASDYSVAENRPASEPATSFRVDNHRSLSYEKRKKKDERAHRLEEIQDSNRKKMKKIAREAQTQKLG